MSTRSKGRIGVVLMTYGSATTAENVREYFGRIYGGKASEALMADFENRYRLVGRSPLIEITQAQAQALEERLGEGYIVRAGMRHSAPFISEMILQCKNEGADRLVGIVLSPQYSPLIMEGYKRSFEEAAAKAGFGHAVIADSWEREEKFVELLATRTMEALETLGGSAPVVFTTHSLPQRVVEKDPAFLQQLAETVSAIKSHLSPDLETYTAYQSAGHTPEEWLKPDLVDILRKIAQEGRKSTLIVPIQFLADHLEVLYDLDVAAKAQCEECGIVYKRIQLPNTHPLFIEALANIVSRSLSSELVSAN